MMNLRPTPAAALSSLYATVNELCASQDTALMQILTMAKLARNTLDGDVEDATDHAGHVLDAIMRIASAVIADLDAAQIEIEDARLRGGEAGDGSILAPSPFASLQPI